MAGRGRELTLPAWMKKQQLAQAAQPQAAAYPPAPEAPANGAHQFADAPVSAPH